MTKFLVFWWVSEVWVGTPVFLMLIFWASFSHVDQAYNLGLIGLILRLAKQDFTIFWKKFEKYDQTSCFLVDFRGLGWDANFSHDDLLELLLLTNLGLIGLILRLAKHDFTIF